MSQPLDARKMINRESPEFEVIDFVMNHQKRGIQALQRLYRIFDAHDSFHMQAILGEADRAVAEQALKENGYDGVIYDLSRLKSWNNTSQDGTAYVVLDLSQVEVIDDNLVEALVRTIS